MFTVISGLITIERIDHLLDQNNEETSNLNWISIFSSFRQIISHWSTFKLFF